MALVADRGAPVRLDFSAATLALSAGGDDEGRAEEQLEVSFDGEDITTAFNPSFLLDGLSALNTDSARLQFISSAKPAVIRAASADAAAVYTYLIMPVRLPGLSRGPAPMPTQVGCAATGRVRCRRREPGR